MIGAVNRALKLPVALDRALVGYIRGCSSVSANRQSISKKQMVMVENSSQKLLRKLSNEAIERPVKGSDEGPGGGSTKGDKGGFRRPPGWVSATVVLASALGGVYLFTFKRSLTREGVKKDVIEQEPQSGLSHGGKKRVTHLKDIPSAVNYLVVGGGTAAFSAVRALRAHAPDSKILVISEEGVVPYMRPPLSKELWHEQGPVSEIPEKISFTHWDGRKRTLSYEPPAFYTPPVKLKSEDISGASLVLGWRATKLTPEAHLVEITNTDGTTTEISYDKCLLVPGSKPRRLSSLSAPRSVGRSLALRSLDDAVLLKRELDKPETRRVLLVGGGFMATELASSLTHTLKQQGKDDAQVIMAYRSAVPMSRVLPTYLANELALVLTQMGVTLLPEEQVETSQIDSDGRVNVKLVSGQQLNVDLVVEAVGHEPRTELASSAGLEIAPDGGIAVNSELQARSDIYVGGDAASYWCANTRRRLRPSHHDHAVHSARHAAAVITGVATTPAFNHSAMFWSDLGPHHGYEATGDIHSSLKTVSIFPKEACQEINKELSTPIEISQEGKPDINKDTPSRRYGRGVVFYLNDKDRVVGVLLWNLYNRMHLARQVLAQGEFDDLLEVAKLFTPQDQ